MRGFLAPLLVCLNIMFTFDARADIGFAAGVTGAESYAKSLVIEQINSYPHYFLSLINNSSFEIRVHELALVTDNLGDLTLIDPKTGKTAAILAKPIFDPRGNIIGAEVYLPPIGVEFHAANGQIVPAEAMAAHETRHVHQMANGDFGMHTDLPDIMAAENDAQRIENQISGHDLDYYGNKRESGSKFYFEGKPIKQGNQNY